MLAALLFPPVASLAALLVSVFVALMAPKDRAAIAGIGCMLVFLGMGFLAIGKDRDALGRRSSARRLNGHLRLVIYDRVRRLHYSYRVPKEVGRSHSW